jgi:hypothetical protein
MAGTKASLQPQVEVVIEESVANAMAELTQNVRELESELKGPALMESTHQRECG